MSTPKREYKFLVTNGPSIHLTIPSDTGNSWVFDTLGDAQQFMLHRWGSTTGKEQYNYKGEDFVNYVNNLTLEQVVKNTDIQWKCKFMQDNVEDAETRLNTARKTRNEWLDIRSEFTDLASDEYLKEKKWNE